MAYNQPWDPVGRNQNINPVQSPPGPMNQPQRPRQTPPLPTWMYNQPQTYNQPMSQPRPPMGQAPRPSQAPLPSWMYKSPTMYPGGTPNFDESTGQYTNQKKMYAGGNPNFDEGFGLPGRNTRPSEPRAFLGGSSTFDEGFGLPRARIQPIGGEATAPLPSGGAAFPGAVDKMQLLNALLKRAASDATARRFFFPDRSTNI